MPLAKCVCTRRPKEARQIDVCRWLVETVGLCEPQHLAPSDAEESTPSQLARYGGHEELAEWLRSVEQRAGLETNVTNVVENPTV